MGSAKDYLHLGPSAAAHDALDAAARDMMSIVLEACAAEAVAICLDAVMPGSDLLCATAAREDGELVSNLQRFLRDSYHPKCDIQVSAVSTQQNDPATDTEFVMLPLEVAQQPLGALAIAVPAHRLASDAAVETHKQIAALVAMNLASSTAKFQLEIDLAEMNRRAHRLSRKAELDALTQVENKASFESKVRQRLTEDRRPAALLALDLDYFKQVNDIYGHQFGDLYLLTIAETLQVTLPDKAIIGRTGGDEFCILVDIPEAGRSYLNSRLIQTRTALQRSVAGLGKPDLGRVSSGVCLFPKQAVSYEQLLGQADLALYASKRTERNTTTIFSNNLAGLNNNPGRWVSTPAAMNFDKITPHFQPIVNFDTGNCDGIEVLARWDDPESGVSGPHRFDWMFRDYRYASKLTIHIVERALQHLQKTRESGWNGTPDIWVNVTTHDLLSPEFVFDLQSVFTEFSINWESVVVEVSEESMLGERSGQIFHSLQEMRRRGGRVALDDFGTGYAGLTHVRDWPVDIIKIDRTFVEQIANDASARVVVQALVMIADALGQNVVAEGIETQAQMSTVLDLGCRLGQGFLLSPAVSGDDLGTSPQIFDLKHLPQIQVVDHHPN